MPADKVLLYFNNCTIKMDDSLVTCSYPDENGTFHRWEISLNDNEIFCRVSGKKDVSFKIEEIREFQFDMSNGAYRYADIPAATAYVILKTDTNPRDFFYFMVGEEYVLMNQTKAHQFCNGILNHIGNRYGIPVAYKLSVDVKTKPDVRVLVLAIMIIIFFVLWFGFVKGS